MTHLNSGTTPAHFELISLKCPLCGATSTNRLTMATWYGNHFVEEHMPDPLPVFQEDTSNEGESNGAT